MKLTRAAIGLAAIVATTAFAPAAVGPGDPSDATLDAIQVGEDPEGDWGTGSQEDAATGAALGQDLTSASIALTEEAFVFEIGLASLPPVGGTPEATRYGWSFTYNGEEFELDGKFTNYSRGACDPTSGQCPPPRDPGLAPFFLRGNCVTDDAANVTTCEELANIEATFDADAATITVPVPIALLAGEDGVNECDVLAPTASFLGDTLWAAPSAFVTSSAMPYDGLYIEDAIVIPSTDPEDPC